MSDPFLKSSVPSPCACRFVRDEDFSPARMVEECLFHKAQREKLEEMESILSNKESNDLFKRLHEIASKQA